MKKTVIAISLAVFVLMAFQVMAHTPAGQGQVTATPSQSLTREQSTKIDAFRQKFMRDTLETRKKLVAKRLELQNLMTQSTVDEAKVTAVHDEILSLQNEIQKKRFEFNLAVRKVAPATAGSYCWGRGNKYGPGMRGHSPMGMGMGYGRHYGWSGPGYRGMGQCPRSF